MEIPVGRIIMLTAVGCALAGVIAVPVAVPLFLLGLGLELLL
ncbi:hypothetical protein RCIP0075_00026 [Klebsiella phage RCIP0075]